MGWEKGGDPIMPLAADDDDGGGDDPSAIVAETPFWDLDEQGELSALGVDGGDNFSLTDGGAEEEGAEMPSSSSSSSSYTSMAGAGLPGESSAQRPRGSDRNVRRVSHLSGGDEGTPQALFAALRRSNPRQFVVPRSQQHLEDIMRTRRGHTIDPAYLLEYVEARGVALTPEQSRSPATLLRKAHKLVFGTSGVRHGDHRARAAGEEAALGRRRNSVSKGRMDAIARSMFENGGGSGHRNKMRH